MMTQSDEAPLSNEEEIKREAQRIAELEEVVNRLLSSPNLVEEVKKLLNCLIAGEEDKKLAHFILCLSGKVQDPAMKQIILLKGEAGAGKSRLAKLSLLFKCKEVGRFTEHALDYSNLQDYQILWLPGATKKTS